MKITTTKPIPLEVVAKIKELLKDKPRELCWFQMSLNTAFRGGMLLKLLRSDIKTVNGRTEITVREDKTNRIRTVLLNEETQKVLENWLKVSPKTTEYIFEGTRGKMNTSYWSVLLKEWCKEVGYEEQNTATHSLRKTWVRTQHEKYNVPLYVLSHALGHSSEGQTMVYMGLLQEGVAEAYMNAV